MVIIEYKSRTWTKGGSNVRSAKMTTINQAMHLLLLAPRSYQKIPFVSKRNDPKGNTSLEEYYARVNKHLIPRDVEIWELNELNGTGNRVEV